MEEEVWDVVWTGFKPGKSRKPGANDADPVLIRVLARGMYRRIPAEQRQAINNGRLVLISPFTENIRRASKRTAIKRNKVAAALADKILIAHAEPGSSTFALAQEVMAWGKPVYTLDHPSNNALIGIGVKPLNEGSTDLMHLG